MSVISQDAFAKIAVNKSLLKEYTSSKYSRVVYLNDGDEFQIQLFNPEQYIIAAKIYLNNEELSDMLVLRPGERIWLERYLDKSKKFKFSTYEVNDNPSTQYAIAHNGEVKVEFYKVKTKKTNPILFVNSSKAWQEPISVYYNSVNTYTGGEYVSNVTTGKSIDLSSDVTPCSSNVNVSLSSCAATMDGCSDGCVTYTSASTIDDTIETGRVEEGGYSNQKFTYVDYDFDNWPFRTETINILPLSRKPVTSNDLRKKYCSNCGRKLSPKHKFCPYCGTKVD